MMSFLLSPVSVCLSKEVIPKDALSASLLATTTTTTTGVIRFYLSCRTDDVQGVVVTLSDQLSNVSCFHVHVDESDAKDAPSTSLLVTTTGVTRFYLSRASEHKSLGKLAGSGYMYAYRNVHAYWNNEMHSPASN